MLRIGICDDIADARLLLQDALERVLEMGGWEAQFFQFSSGEGLVEWFAKHSGELDLVFLDMEMKALDGIATAKRLRAMDENLQLVFCTSYADYVYDGYGTGALGYLLKPPTFCAAPRKRCCARWIAPTSVAVATSPIAFRCATFSILFRSGARCAV